MKKRERRRLEEIEANRRERRRLEEIEANRREGKGERGGENERQ